LPLPANRKAAAPPLISFHGRYQVFSCGGCKGTFPVSKMEQTARRSDIEEIVIFLVIMGEVHTFIKLVCLILEEWNTSK
jgi:hypothetical protein